MRVTDGDIDIWAHYAAGFVACVPTNGIVANGRLVMGAGLALQAKKRFPGIDLTLGKLVSEKGNHCHPIFGADGSFLRLVSFPTKNHWRNQPDPALIVRSARELAGLADANNWSRVVLPAVGCGLGGLSWESLYRLLADMLDDRFTVTLWRQSASVPATPRAVRYSNPEGSRPVRQNYPDRWLSQGHGTFKQGSSSVQNRPSLR